MESLRGIGQMSRESGLTISALRFYDGAGVLSPAHVDPQSGYRFYAVDQLGAARLVATLRRVGMPLAGIRRVLAWRHDPVAVDGLLAEHLLRLEQGLADARRELSCVRTLLTQEEPVPTTTVTVAAADLATALRAVRFAVGTDPELPVLGGVLLDVADGALTLVATDRYRLAVAPVPVPASEGPPVAALVPATFADELAVLAAASAADPITITIEGTTVSARAGHEVRRAAVIPDAFPDYRRLLPDPDGETPVGAALHEALTSGPTRTMRREQDGVEFEAAVLEPGAVGVNREFLLEALDASDGAQLQLSLDGPIAPLVIRSARSVSLLMPVRL